MKNLSIITAIITLSALQLNAQSPYISKVYEYRPAPGQFINLLPKYEDGDNAENLRLKAEENLANNNQVMISLGGYGGYVVFGFDHSIENKNGEFDFKILGNAFHSDAVAESGSCEPGIVMVSYDANANGIPDDEWFELAGSEYNSAATIHNYSITYKKPAADHVPTPDNAHAFLSDTTYISWSANNGTSGYVYQNTFHSQAYYPLWIDENEMTFSGTKLADNYLDQNGNGSYYVQYSYAWGYADNHPDADIRSNFNIDWAVDSEGNSVSLSKVDFIKVYGAVNQYCGWMGETSTEVKGAQDLHLLPDNNSNIDTLFSTSAKVSLLQSKQSFTILQNPVREIISINSLSEQSVTVYNMTGAKVTTLHLSQGSNKFACENLSQGIYLLCNRNRETVRFIKK